MAANQSKDELERLYYERQLAAGSGVGTQVNVTNDPLKVTPTDALGTGVATVNIGNFPVDSEPGLTDAQLRATPVPVDTGLATQLDALTNTQLRATPVEVSLEGTEILGFTSPTAAKKVAEGKFFIAGKAISLGGLGSTERATFQFSNPVGNTKAAYIVAVVLYSNVAQQIIYYKNATFSGTATTPQNINFASATVSTMAASHGVGTVTGSPMPNESRVFSTSPLALQFPPLVLPPGMSLTIRGSSGDAQIFTANCYYYEE